MNVKEFEKKEKSTAELTVEVSPEEFEAAVNKAYLKNRGRISIPGFRKGKAPRRMIESMYGAGVFYDDAAEEVFPEAYEFGVKEKELSPVGRPSVMDMNVGEDKSLTVKFLVSLYPEITLKAYKGLEAPKPAVQVLDADVEKEIGATREKNARVETVERAAQNGDIVTIDFEGFVDGAAFEGGKGENYDLELGSNTFIPGFEGQLVGAEAGSHVDVNVTFPEQYAPELAGKDATFKVEVKSVKEKSLPELDDEFAKDVSEFDTYQEYFDSVKASILESRKDQAEKDFRDLVLGKLVENVEGEIPDAMIDEHVDQMIQNFRYNLQAQGIPMETYLQMMGMDESGIKADIRPTAEREVKADLAFEAVAKAENFEVTDEELEAEYQRLSEQYGMKVEDIKNAVSAESVKTGLAIGKAQELVYASAKAEEKPAEETEEAPQEA